MRACGARIDRKTGWLNWSCPGVREPSELFRRTADLKELRNELAHMEPLTVEESLYRGLL